MAFASAKIRLAGVAPVERPPGPAATRRFPRAARSSAGSASCPPDCPPRPVASVTRPLGQLPMVHLVSVLDPAPALADVGVGLEQAHHLLLRGHRELPPQHPADRLAHDHRAQIREWATSARHCRSRSWSRPSSSRPASTRPHTAAGVAPPQQLAVHDLTLHPRLGNLPLPCGFAARGWSCEAEDIGSQLLRGHVFASSRDGTRTASYRQLAVARLQDVQRSPSRCCRRATTCRPSRSRLSGPLPSRARLIRSARSPPALPGCSADAERFGGRTGSIRVNRLAEAESASTNSRR